MEKKDSMLDAIMRINKDALSTFRINLSKNTISNGVSVYDNLTNLQRKGTFDGYVKDALAHFPFYEERENFVKKISRENLLREFENGNTQVSMIHHYRLFGKEQRILNTIVDMVLNQATGDIEGIVYTLDMTREFYDSKINDHFFNNKRMSVIIINPKENTFVMPQTSMNIPFPSGYEEKNYDYGIEETGKAFVNEEERPYYNHACALSTILENLKTSPKYVFTCNWMENGEKRHIRFSYYYFDEAQSQIIGLVEDITEITKAEKEQVELYRKALDEVEKANHAKSDFMSNMSHDIRTPLNAIINLTNMLSEEIDSKEKLRSDIQKIEVAGEFLLQIVNDVLDVASIESGKVTLNPRVYTYATFLNYIKGIIVPLCENKDIKFVLDEGPTALDIYMDRARFHQVFFNILSNAVKYTPPGGTVTFTTTNNVVHDGILTCDFIVTDTGCGMSKEFLERAFEPFEREDYNSAYVGTGLGLTICKRIVDLMGGNIKIESELGKGTKVTVHMNLPLATEKQKKESQVELGASYRQSPATRENENVCVLIVEDNNINKEIIGRLLTRKKYKVDFASNGKEAVDKIRARDENFYSMVLMDIRMPIMDGYEATKHIREEENEKKRNLPIIAITANAFTEDADECMKRGMNAYLSKPVSPSALYEVVATYSGVNPSNLGK